MQLTREETSQRHPAKITDSSSGEEIGSISHNPEKSVLQISLNGVQDLSEGAPVLRKLANTLESDSSNGDSGATQSPAEGNTETEGATKAEASPEESTNTEETPEVKAAADESAETDVTADTDAAAPISSPEELSTWVANQQTNDASPTPGRPIQEVRVESWLQVPEILRALHNNEGPLRITYPAQGNSAIAEEQTAVSKFLIENAGQSLAGMLAALDDKIKSCHMVTSERVSLEVTQEYLQSFSGAISAESSPLLTVAEVARLNDSFKPLKNGNPSAARQNTAAREQILGTITDTMANTGEYHTCIIEVPTDYVDIAKIFINEKWTAIPEDSRPPTKHTKVWVADDFVSSASIEEIDFEKFLEGAIGVPKPRQRKKKESQSSSSPVDMILS